MRCLYYHCPIKLLLAWVTVEAIEDGRNETSSNQAYDSDVVQLVAKLGTTGEWFEMVWYVPDIPRHNAAPAKKNEKARISDGAAVSYLGLMVV